MLQKNGRQEAYVKDRIKKMAIIMEQGWKIGNRLEIGMNRFTKN